MSKKAFLIGKSTKGLKFAEKDISLMKECLVQYDYEIYIPQQDKPSIMEKFDDFIDEINHIDTVLFYYSGHGHLEGGELFLIFGDEISKNKHKIEINYFLKRINNSSSNNKLIILDCCNALNISDEWKPSQLSRHKILTASGQWESAKEVEELGSSYFTHVFHESLLNPYDIVNCDGEILIQEFYENLVLKARQYNDTKNTKIAIPNLIGNSQINFPIAHVDKHYLSNNSKDTSGIRNSGYTNQIFTNLPDPDYDLFVGRDSELTDLFDYLSPEFTRKCILIFGFGGVGKTSLAIAAAKHCWDSKYNYSDKNIPKFDSIIYITFKEFYFKPEGINRIPNGQSSLNDIFRVIIDMYDVGFINELSEKDKTEKIYQLLKQQRNLLIIDNIDALDEIEHKKIMGFIDYIPRPTKIIITSRCQISSPVSIKVNLLNREDSIKLINNQLEIKKLTLPNSEDICIRLYDKFQGIPIALICAVGQLSLKYPIDYVLDTNNDNNSANSTPEQLAYFCFENSIKLLRGKPAHKLLMAMVIFSNTSSRSAIITVSAVGANTQVINEAFALLDQLSLVVTDSFRYDSVSILREYISSDLEHFDAFEVKARPRWVQWYLRYVRLHGGYDFQNWRDKYDKLELELENILSVLNWCELNNKYDDIKKIWVDIDCYIDLVGHWDMRIYWWSYIKEYAYLRDKKMYVRSLVDLGWTYTLLGADHSQLAINEYIEALKNINDATPETKITLFKNIAVLKITQKKYYSALFWLNESNKILDQIHSPQLKSKLVSRFSIINKYYASEVSYKLAEIHQDTDEFRESLRLFQETNKNAIYHGWDRITNYCNNHLGNILTVLGETQEARIYLENGLVEARNSKESRRIALYQLSLALLEEKEGNIEMVKKYSSDALKVFRSSVMREECEITESLFERVSTLEEAPILI